MKSIRIITLGCSKNSVDSEHLLSMLPETSYTLKREEGADILLINTCGFIGDAKQESIQTILEAVEAKKEGLYGRIAVFGCLSQRYSKELPLEIPEVDAWFGARDLEPVADWIGIGRENKAPRRLEREGLPYAYLKI